MKVLILGGDGYLGWPTAMYLSRQGHEVAIVDNMVKRFWEAQIGVEPLIPIASLSNRIKSWKDLTGKHIDLYVGDISDNSKFVYNTFDSFDPDAVIHYAEQPSAPFSMRDRHSCYETQRNNILGTLNVLFAIQHHNPSIHLVKLGTMGEYGTPNIDIEEGWLDVTHNGRTDKVLFPKRPPSFYHLSKVHDSANLEFVCRAWGLSVTDLNQGIVYGVRTEETDLHPDLETSFHYDDVFGTILNRFIVQACCNHPLTVYGKGGQTRGMLNINDTLKCIEIAISNPAKAGEFRVFNQFTEMFGVNQLADLVKQAAHSCDITNVIIRNLPNPRTESDDHYFNAKNTSLLQLGLKPVNLDIQLIQSMIAKILPHINRVDQAKLLPSVQWLNRVS